MKNPDLEIQSLSRRHFLEGCALTLGVAMIGAGCSSPNSGPPAAVAQGADFFIADATLPAPGEAVAFQFPDGQPGLFFQTRAKVAGAVSAKCTHAGCTVEWSGDENPAQAFRCPCHQSLFALDGAAKSGPAKKPLQRHIVEVEDGGLRLKANT